MGPAMAGQSVGEVYDVVDMWLDLLDVTRSGRDSGARDTFVYSLTCLAVQLS